MGVPLRESQQKYEYMQASYKTQLNENVARLIENGILDEIFVTEFTRQYDNQTRVNSLDLVRMANSLLTCPTDFKGEGAGNGRNQQGADRDGDRQTAEQLVEDFGDFGEQGVQFLDAVPPVPGRVRLTSDMELIKKCQQFAIEQQKGIVNTTFTLFQKNKIKKCSLFTYAIINHESLGWVRDLTQAPSSAARSTPSIK